MNGKVCIVMGSEGTGMHRLVREKCDFLVSIPLPATWIPSMFPCRRHPAVRVAKAAGISHMRRK